MKRSKKVLYLFYIIIVVACVVGITFYCVEVYSCKLPITFSSCFGEYTNNGTYYLTRNGVKDKSTYITLKNGEWEDSDGLSGTYEVTSKGVIIFYAGNSSIEFIRGTVGGGKLELQVTSTSTVLYTT